MAIAPTKCIISPKALTPKSSLLPFPAKSPSSLSFTNPQSLSVSQTLILKKTLPPISVSSISTPPDTASPEATPATKPTVLVSEKLSEAGLDVLRAFADVDCSYNLSPAELCSKISSCDALIVRSGTKVTREVFEAAKGKLKVVGRAGVGIDNVDLQAATEYGCLVVNAPTANTVAAAEHGIALMAAMARNVAMADASMKAGENN